METVSQQRHFNVGEYSLVATLFLRCLALIYLSAFLSIGVQIEGLAGPQGILPFTDVIEHYTTEAGISKYWKLPTLFWLDASNAALIGVAYAGCIFSLFLFFNLLPRTSLFILLILYLSLYHAGQLFMNFQWDYLLMESGFLALFLTSRSRIVIWMFRWLLFRFRFLSGASKLISGDPSWASLTAVIYYFEVQPLPNWLSWYAHHLPDWLLTFGAGLTLFVELVIPFMMFLPRRYRFVAAWITIVLQVIIMITSNHNWFNLLTIALCLFLFDDKAIQRALPSRFIDWLIRKPLPVPSPGKIYRYSFSTVSAVLVFVSIILAGEMFVGEKATGLTKEIVNVVRPFHIVNNYHVFPTMKTERIELVISGSIDGNDWQTYTFKYKPGDANVYPEIVIPHQPRLDWLAWFVTIHPMFVPWYEKFLYALMDNRPDVVGLLENNPFPDKPPNYLNIDAFRYTFTDWKTKQETGNWWNVEYLGPFPPLPGIYREQSQP
ncbi:MAG: lipase maturation factor family protein [Gammaproteobacteria bacterium]|nr:MAG: lipase maturation factor family protein [Gammaproteobacteria bacterium]